VIALCGITYELVIGTLSSYLLGSSVTQFSVTIGLFMAAMGLGSWASRFLEEDLPDRFVEVEIALALVGGLSVMGLFAAFSYTGAYRVAMVVSSLAIGTLVGLEIPILTRIVRTETTLKEALASVLAWDYLGALVGSLLFPLVLLPTLGLVQVSVAMGLLNVAVALLAWREFGSDLRRGRRLLVAGGAVAAILALAFVFGGGLAASMEQRLYRDEVVLVRQSPYQRIVVTRWRDDLRMYIDGNIQFSSTDEHRYHEALVHPAMTSTADRSRVLLLGGGDGLGAREILRYPDVRELVIVDLDPAVTELARELAPLVRLNEGALDDPRVRLIHEDAWTWLAAGRAPFGVVIADLPDPNNAALAKLYSVPFYRMVRRVLAPGGLFVTQSTSPLAAADAFWCIHRTVEEAFCEGGPEPCERVRPYHALVPTFGDWGFQLASAGASAPLPAAPSMPTRFLDASAARAMTLFPADMAERDVRPSRLLDPVILRYYVSGWARTNG
jgi:spermidine synthase